MDNVFNGYELQNGWGNKNGGNSKWGFAVKNKHLYFIKELISPVYPMDESAMSPTLLKQRREFCEKFEERYKKIYNIINNASCGNLIRIIDFFRCDGKYYVVSERAGDNAFSVDKVCQLPHVKKCFLMKSAAFGFACLHQAGMVHFDVKPNNIIIKETLNKQYVAKLIDFDAGFLKEEIGANMEVEGDPTYFAPESILYMMEENDKLDEKLDIFSLGLVFHEYYCGKLPYIDKDQFDYCFEATLELGHIEPDKSIPKKVSDLIGAMIDRDPQKRPSAQEVVDKLSEIIAEDSGKTVHKTEVPISDSEAKRKWFVEAGDLSL